MGYWTASPERYPYCIVKQAQVSSNQLNSRRFRGACAVVTIFCKGTTRWRSHSMNVYMSMALVKPLHSSF